MDGMKATLGSVGLTILLAVGLCGCGTKAPAEAVRTEADAAVTSRETAGAETYAKKIAAEPGLAAYWPLQDNLKDTKIDAHGHPQCAGLQHARHYCAEAPALH